MGDVQGEDDEVFRPTMVSSKMKLELIDRAEELASNQVDPGKKQLGVIPK